MAVFTYKDFRKVLARLGFEMRRSRKHETWEKRLPDGRSHRVSISHKHGKDIPRTIFYKMLKQAGIERGNSSRYCEVREMTLWRRNYNVRL
jgi:predicted RNA binding protein YcfA (HicA-like mRNA interferase family)